jgi:hypothetical protein
MRKALIILVIFFPLWAKANELIILQAENNISIPNLSFDIGAENAKTIIGWLADPNEDLFLMVKIRGDNKYFIESEIKINRKNVLRFTPFLKVKRTNSGELYWQIRKVNVKKPLRVDLSNLKLLQKQNAGANLSILVFVRNANGKKYLEIGKQDIIISKFSEIANQQKAKNILSGSEFEYRFDELNFVVEKDHPSPFVQYAKFRLELKDAVWVNASLQNATMEINRQSFIPHLKMVNPNEIVWQFGQDIADIRSVKLSGLMFQGIGNNIPVLYLKSNDGVQLLRYASFAKSYTFRKDISSDETYIFSDEETTWKIEPLTFTYESTEIVASLKGQNYAAFLNEMKAEGTFPEKSVGNSIKTDSIVFYPIEGVQREMHFNVKLPYFAEPNVVKLRAKVNVGESSFELSRPQILWRKSKGIQKLGPFKIYDDANFQTLYRSDTLLYQLDGDALRFSSYVTRAIKSADDKLWYIIDDKMNSETIGPYQVILNEKSSQNSVRGTYRVLDNKNDKIIHSSLVKNDKTEIEIWDLEINLEGKPHLDVWRNLNDPLPVIPFNLVLKNNGQNVIDLSRFESYQIEALPSLPNGWFFKTDWHQEGTNSKVAVRLTQSLSPGETFKIPMELFREKEIHGIRDFLECVAFRLKVDEQRILTTPQAIRYGAPVVKQKSGRDQYITYRSESVRLYAQEIYCKNWQQDTKSLRIKLVGYRGASSLKWDQNVKPVITSKEKPDELTQIQSVNINSANDILTLYFAQPLNAKTFLLSGLAIDSRTGNAGDSLRLFFDFNSQQVWHAQSSNIIKLDYDNTFSMKKMIVEELYNDIFAKDNHIVIQSTVPFSQASNRLSVLTPNRQEIFEPNLQIEGERAFIRIRCGKYDIDNVAADYEWLKKDSKLEFSGFVIKGHKPAQSPEILLNTAYGWLKLGDYPNYIQFRPILSKYYGDTLSAGFTIKSDGTSIDDEMQKILLGKSKIAKFLRLPPSSFPEIIPIDSINILVTDLKKANNILQLLPESQFSKFWLYHYLYATLNDRVVKIDSAKSIMGKPISRDDVNNKMVLARQYGYRESHTYPDWRQELPSSLSINEKIRAIINTDIKERRLTQAMSKLFLLLNSGIEKDINDYQEYVINYYSWRISKELNDTTKLSLTTIDGTIYTQNAIDYYQDKLEGIEMKFEQKDKTDIETYFPEVVEDNVVFISSGASYKMVERESFVDGKIIQLKLQYGKPILPQKYLWQYQIQEKRSGIKRVPEYKNFGEVMNIQGGAEYIFDIQVKKSHSKVLWGAIIAVISSGLFICL